jgi:hypothetical protein
MPNKLRETTMRQFTMSAAVATVFVALLASAPVRADLLNGAPKQAGNQCFTLSTGQGRDERFGMWGACPKTASVAVAPRHVRKHHSR